MPDMRVQSGTQFQDIQRQFSQLDPKLGSKHLRLDEGRGMHLHDTGKWSGIGAKALERREMKHDQAFKAVMRSIDEQLGKPGMGEQILKNVLSRDQFDNKLISVKDLDRIGREVGLTQDRMDVEAKKTERENELAPVKLLLEQKIPDDFELRDTILQSLRDDPQVDARTARKALENFDQVPTGETRRQLLKDLRDEDTGPLQALARHNVVGSSLGEDEGFKLKLARGNDLVGLSYGDVSQRNTRMIGSRYHTENSGGVITCKLNGLEEREHTRESRRTEDTLQISVSPRSIGEAWSDTLQIVRKFPDLVQELSVNDTGDLPLEGKITLRFHEGREGVDPGRVRELLDELKSLDNNRNIEPGPRPEGSKYVSNLCSYGYDRPGTTEMDNRLRFDLFTGKHQI